MNLKQLIKFGLENSSDPVIKNPVLRSALEKPRSMDQAALVDELEPGELKDEMLGKFDPKQETYEEYLQRINLERPFNMNQGGRIGFSEKPGSVKTKADRFIKDEEIKLLKETLDPKDFKKLDFNSVVHGISNRKRAGWIGISSKSGDKSLNLLREKVALILNRGFKNPERQKGIKERAAEIAKRNSLIDEAVKNKKPLNIIEMTKKIGMNDKGMYIKDYITDMYGQDTLFKIFPNQKTNLRLTVTKLAKNKKIQGWLQDGTILNKKNLSYIANTYFNKDIDAAGRTLYHLGEALEGEKSHWKNLNLPEKTKFKKGLDLIFNAAESDAFGNPAGHIARNRKERLVAKQIGEKSKFFKNSRTALNTAAKELFAEYGIKPNTIGTAVDEIATITVPYKHKGGGYSVYVQQLAKTGNKMTDDLNMVKARKMDSRLGDIRKALADGTATQKMVDDYNTAVSQIAGDINKDVPKGGKKLQPFLIKMGGDPRETVSNFKQLMKQNPLAAEDMLNVAKNQGWSGVIQSDVQSIYDLQDPDKVKSSITESIHNVFGTKNKELIKKQIQITPKKKIQNLFKKFAPRLVEAPTEDNRLFASKGGRVPLAGGGWLVSLLGPEAVVLEYIFYKASKNNYESQGYSEEEAKAMAIDEITFGITNKSDAAYNKELKKVAKEMGIDSKAFDTIREISKRNSKIQSELERDKQLLGSGHFQTEEAKNEFLDKRDKLYGDYNEETQRLWRKAKTEIGMDKAGKVFPTPSLDEIAFESLNTEDDDVISAFGDLQKVATEKLRKRKEKAFPMQSKQVNTDQGWLGNVLTNNLWNLQSIPRTVKTAYDLINPFSPLPKLDDLKSDAALEQSKMDKMSDEELYEHNKKRNITKEDPITEESREEIRYRYPELHLREGGIASIRRPNAIPPESGPTPQGLPSMYNRVRRI